MVQEREGENIDNNNDNQELFDDSEPNTWVATQDMQGLPTAIFRKNILPQSIRKSLLQSEPRNKDISFEPPIMDRKLWSSMPRKAKEHDKNLRRTIYRFSSVIRPIDNALRSIYASRPDEDNGETYDAWSHLEQTILNARALALDALSFANEIRQEQALKATISPTYHKPPEKEEVFGEELHDAIKTENETNKLLNDAAWQRKRASQDRNQRSNYTNSNLNFKFPSSSSNYKGNHRRNHYNKHKKSHSLGNEYRSGQSQNNRQE